jgi:hypothetical protein
MQAMVSKLDDDTFQKLMQVATTNLVDSNVFIRSAFLSIERIALMGGGTFLPTDDDHAAPDWSPSFAQLYLSHSWFDNPIRSLDHCGPIGDDGSCSMPMDSDWFPVHPVRNDNNTILESFCETMFDWSFVPSIDMFSPETYSASTIERLGWFLVANQSRLLRRLLDVVSLQNINHENICCVNTAVVIVIFAHRRNQLPALIHELKEMDRVGSIHATGSNNTATGNPAGDSTSAFKLDAVHTFRQLLWFWQEYYGHRGRDRLSLEFSSHMRFHEWDAVVKLLTSDDASPYSLLNAPMRLPRSPYHRAAMVDMTMPRGR